MQNKPDYTTDLVILAAGQASRMQGQNKLLQCFDEKIQLLKIHQQLSACVDKVWINSHRDQELYQQYIAGIACYADDEPGFLGPLMGIKSAWSYVTADYVLFVPCDVLVIPEDVVQVLHRCLLASPLSEVAVVSINQQALFPFCLLKRSALPVLCEQINQRQLSLKKAFAKLHMQVANFDYPALFFHSINSSAELQCYKDQKNNI